MTCCCMCDSDAGRRAVEYSDDDDDKDDGLWSDTEFDIEFDEPPPVSYLIIYTTLASRVNPASLKRAQ